MQRKSYRRGLQASRPSRRRVLQLTGLSGGALVAAGLIGCGQNHGSTTSSKAGTGTASSAGSSTPVSKQPKKGGTITRVPSTDGSPFGSGFDPHVLNASPDAPMGLFYQTLIRRNLKDLSIEPELAQKWEQPSQLEFLFHVAPGIKWQNKPPVNARALTAQDITFSFERIRTNDPKFINRSRLASVDKIEAVDSNTVRITTKQPDATTLANLSDATMEIITPEVVQKYGTGKLATPDTVIGTGAFILTANDDTGGTVVRNPDYWKPGLPYLDGMKMVYILDRQTRWSAFLAGRTDIEQVPGSEAKQFLAEKGKSYFIDYWTDIGAYQHWVNTTKPPFNDARVSRALRLLLDHHEAITAWAEVWFGSGQLVSHLQGAFADWDYSASELEKMLEWRQPKDDAAKEALALLSAAGYTKDNPLKFLQDGTTTDYVKASAELAQAQWRRLSQGVVQPDLKLFENVAQISRMSNGDFDLGGPAVRSSYLDPGPLLQTIYRTGGSQNFGKWSDPAADALIDKQGTIFDVAERKATVKQLLAYLIDHAPYVQFCARKGPSAAKPFVKDYSAAQLVEPFFQFEHIWLDT